MEKLKHYQEVLKLGKKISKEFSTDQRNITLKWMGNHIAYLMYYSEMETNPLKKVELQKQCYNTILKLWNLREQLSKRLQPLGNYKNVISVLNSLNEKGTSFDWQRFNNFDDPISWGNFVKQLKKNYSDAIEISICAAVNPEYLAEGKAWMRHKKMLSKEEKIIIDQLEHLLTKNDSPIRLMIVNGNKPDVKKTKSHKAQIIEKLTEIIETQNMALTKLKESIEETVK